MKRFLLLLLLLLLFSACTSKDDEPNRRRRLPFAPPMDKPEGFEDEFGPVKHDPKGEPDD